MSAQIKRYSLSEFGGFFIDEEYGHIVDYTDHLAAMAAASAYDEDKERALFEAVEISEGSDIAKDQDGDYMNQVVGQCWGSWKACAKARAKAV
jgi:hypothetical protein